MIELICDFLLQTLMIWILVALFMNGEAICIRYVNLFVMR